jgi:hypothetical protein
MTDVTLGEQIAAVQREIGMRERVYPGLVAKGKMKLDESERQIAAMKAVLETLRRGAETRDQWSPRGKDQVAS